jgi:flagellin
MRINQNIMAFNAYRNLSSTNNVMGKSLEKLSSGFRINRAADDAAGLVISQGLRAQVSGLRQATRNAQDGISVVQTAEGALNEVHSMLNRMRDLAVQASNSGSNDTAARTAAQEEVNQLRQELDRMASATKFGSMELLDGNFGVTAGTVTGIADVASVDFDGDETFTVAVTGGSGAVTVSADDTGALAGEAAAQYLTDKVRAGLRATGNAVDAAAAEKITVNYEDSRFTVENKYSADVTLADTANDPLANDLQVTPGAVAAATGSGGRFQVGANENDFIDVAITSVSVSELGLNGANIDLVNDAEASITNIQGAIETVSSSRGELGAVQNRFESTISNLQVTTENLAASESRIRDTDMALEMVSFTRHQILLQAGTAMLGQANGLPQSVLRLLG